ncbi:MAG: terminase small subunit [Arenicella sp.]|nr:terminase small subunit [Arenicella sp.]
MKKKLTPKQKLFVEEYLIDLCASKACIRAGYSAKTATAAGSRLLANVKVKEKIDEAKAARSQVVKIDAEYVLKQSVKLHERCMSEASPVMVRQGKDWVQDEDEHGNKLFKFDASGAAKGLELIGKHITVQSFNEKKSLTLDLENATTEELEAELAALKRGDDE